MTPRRRILSGTLIALISTLKHYAFSIHFKKPVYRSKSKTGNKHVDVEAVNRDNSKT